MDPQRFAERPTELLVEDAYRLGALPLALAAICGVFGWQFAAFLFSGVAIFVASFFRNPDRFVPGDESCVVSPADGRVLDVSEIEGPDGRKSVRIGIFLSVFNVHVNRAPLAGRVVSVEKSGDAYLAAYNPEAETRNVRCDMTLEMASGTRIRVSQITGLIARRIICYPVVGDVLRRGDRYGYIRFGSRTDVVLPVESEVLVVRGDRVKGGRDILARLPARDAAGAGSIAEGA